MKTIEEMLRQHIAENILFSSKGYPYPDDASLLENGIIDSMNVMELVLFLEETLGIQVEDVEIVPENFDSVSNLAEFARQKQPRFVSA
ncbi:MAG: acyl carrier protein [Coleofasciculus sp. A1-SPW-01]|uniref:acyl carrier protein n=1 Tax=Coleofasciculus sp. A1-SPW-01 TaxID=3070819 RepID=UPI003302278E